MEELVRKEAARYLRGLVKFLKEHKENPSVLERYFSGPVDKEHLSDHINQLEKAIERIEKGEGVIEELPPGEGLYLLPPKGSRFGLINDHHIDAAIKLTNEHGVIQWSSPRILYGGAIIVGRIGRTVGYHSVHANGVPKNFRTLSKDSILSMLVSRVHGIILPHPDPKKAEEGHAVYLHLGKTPYMKR